MGGVHKCSADGIPQLLAGSRRKFIVAAFLRLSSTEKLLAYFVGMLVKETVQNNGISVVKGGIQPLLVSILGRNIFLVYLVEHEAHFGAKRSLTLISLR